LNLFVARPSSPRRRLTIPTSASGGGYATVSLRTKKINGLHENDFIMAVKLNRLANATAMDGSAD
jgi:4a-hydroxytetrahydrobiopterin dehydratase